MSLSLAAAISIIASGNGSCSLLSPSRQSLLPAHGNPGAGIISWRDFLFVIGGTSAEGRYSNEVWRARVGSDGAPADWARVADLPKGLAFGACVAYGSKAYVFGGRGPSGISDDIYLAQIEDDGSLGFTGGWAENPRPLPSGRAGAAPLVHDGRVFLIGGEGPGEEESPAIHAGFWSDGQVGTWYECPSRLPRSGPAMAVAADRGEIWAAGASASGMSMAAFHAAFDANGLPGQWAEAPIPGALALSPLLVATADGLQLLGGIGEDAIAFGPTRVLKDGAWAESSSVPAWGPHHALLFDRIFYIESTAGLSHPVVGSRTVTARRADEPRVRPGSGTIRQGLVPDVAAMPGDDVRYSWADLGSPPADPDDSSPLWTGEAPPPPGRAYAFRAFRSGSAASTIARAAYRVRRGSAFPMLKRTLYPSSGSPPYSTFELTESYSGGSSADAVAVWFKVVVATPTSVKLDWADKDAASGGAAYTAGVRVSLFEGDMWTAARAIDGAEAVERRCAGSAPLRFALGAGDYYLLVEYVEGASGGSFGVSIGGS